MGVLRAWIRVLLVALACVASGTLECGGKTMTANEARGAALYDRMCAVCHGRQGQGYVADNAPAITNPHFLSMVTDAYLDTAIGNGRSGTTMSAWSRMRSGPLGYPEVQSVVAYLRTFEALPRVTGEGVASTGDTRRGEKVYATQCIGCHGEHGTGGPYVHIGNPDLLGSTGNGMLRATIHDGRPGTPMPSFAEKLSRDDIEGVIALLRQWQGQAPPAPLATPAKMPPLPLGAIPLHPKGPEPDGFKPSPATTPGDIVKRELDRGAKMGLLDARAPSDYIGEHITGAVSVPFYDPDPYLAQLPHDAWLVCYCACPHAESGQLARRLTEKGFTKVTILDEGLGVWRSKKYGTSSGLDP
jgi:cytochrome c oxidase cbb3-type subunit 3/ubiquinol-cytochrome c reductase cytochrome c subunit